MNQMKHNGENRKYMDEAHLVKLCREARARARSESDEDLLWELLVRVREDLKSGDPRDGLLLPIGNTRREMLINNIFQHFNHQYDWPLSLNISGTINRELLHKREAPVSLKERAKELGRDL
jgi:hypothetical protein